jgi:hypothetical protein
VCGLQLWGASQSGHGLQGWSLGMGDEGNSPQVNSTVTSPHDLLLSPTWTAHHLSSSSLPHHLVQPPHPTFSPTFIPRFCEQLQPYCFWPLARFTHSNLNCGSAPFLAFLHTKSPPCSPDVLSHCAMRYHRSSQLPLHLAASPPVPLHRSQLIALR